MSKKVVIVGGGFGGLTAAKEFVDKDFQVTIIDRTNYHLFQPLLYQVATAALSPGDIAVPIRAVFKNAANVSVIMSEVTHIDKLTKTVVTADTAIPYDHLILAPGSRHSYFGNDAWGNTAPGLKDLEDALLIREKILKSFESAEKCEDTEERRALITFVVIGGGPTGVEMAGAIAEMAKKDMVNDFRNINSADAVIYLIEAMPHILSSYSESLSSKAKDELLNMGVKVLNGKFVTGITENTVTLGDEVIMTHTIIWAAGNQASPLLRTLETELDKAGRAVVEPDLSIKGYPEIFVIGDSALFIDKKQGVLPGIATVAMQQARHAAQIILENQSPEKRAPFKYINKGSMATIGRAKAIAVVAGMEFSGIIAWMLWSFIHVMYLIGFRNRFKVMAEWIWYYISFRHGIRLITRRS